MGTIGYMSPEQLRGRIANHRSDIFSFGAILYEMLAGQRAFRGESTADTMSAILREDPPELSSTNKNIAPALERVVNHCLEKNPEERFHSASDLAFAIEALSGSGSTTTLLTAVPASRKRRFDLLPWIAAAILLLSTIALAALYFRRAPIDERPVRFVIAMPDNAAEVSYPVISPDGRTVAFIATVEGNRFLFIRSLASVDAQRLAGTEGATLPFWSPDSRSLGFFSSSKLRKIDAGGGPPQSLCDVSSPLGGTWNRDGVILFSSETKGISRLSAAGGVPTPILKLDVSRKEVIQAWPTFLPDGRHFLYQSWNGQSDDSAIFVSALDGTDRRLVVKADSNPTYAAPGYLLFARGATLTAQAFDAAKFASERRAFSRCRGS